MGIKDKRKAAARATAARLLAMKAQVENPALHDVEILESNTEGSVCESVIMSKDSDCGMKSYHPRYSKPARYPGVYPCSSLVNCHWSNSDYSDSEDFDGGDYSDTESLEELEGDELEANLYKSHRRIPDTVAHALDAV
ncbi:hypothetical protein EV424DRAFT_1344420 [Suillus variegatus]|nr:hypothetical protein EV424DRAFT_1344420 [Suillus variegatus]